MKTISALLVWCLPAHFKSFLSSSSSSIPDSVAWWISALVSPFVSYYQQQLRLQLQVLSGYTLPPSGGSPVVCESWRCILVVNVCNSVMWVKPSDRVRTSSKPHDVFQDYYFLIRTPLSPELMSVEGVYRTTVWSWQLQKKDLWISSSNNEKFSHHLLTSALKLLELHDKKASQHSPDKQK